jgi:hypothetical protein
LAVERLVGPLRDRQHQIDRRPLQGRSLDSTT